jgi:hypothetical protein
MRPFEAPPPSLSAYECLPQAVLFTALPDEGAAERRPMNTKKPALWRGCILAPLSGRPLVGVFPG